MLPTATFLLFGRFIKTLFIQGFKKYERISIYLCGHKRDFNTLLEAIQIMTE